MSLPKNRGRLTTKAAECQYKEYGRVITEQFIHGLKYDGMINEIFKEVAALEDIVDTTSKHVLLWVYRVEAQSMQKISPQ